MSLKLHELLVKAKEKGFLEKNELIPTRPWQEESTLYSLGTSHASKVEVGNEETVNKALTNRKQTVSKVLTNRKQTVSKVLTNRKQTVNKVLTNQEDLTETVNKVLTNRKQTVNKTVNKVLTNRKQTEREIMPQISLYSLTGLQRAITIFIYNECKASGTKETNQLPLEYISNTLKTSCKTIKTTVHRLTKRKYIRRVESKNGRGGWSRYELPENIYEEIFKDELNLAIIETNRKQTVSKVLTNDLYVSSSYINTTTTEEEEKKISNLPSDWSQIDYSALESFGFDEARLIQIHRAYKNNPDISLTPEIIQDSITHFAYDLEHNNAKANFRNPPVAVITSMLKKGTPYSSTTPEQVKTPREIAMLKYLESKSAADTQNKAIENELQKVELGTWLDSMTADELLEKFYDPERLKELEKKTGFGKSGFFALACRDAKELASEYFALKIWPGKKQEILERPAQADATETGNVAV